VSGRSGNSWNGPSGQAPLNAHSGDESADYDFFDIFVLKLASNGAYRWHAFYGGGDWDYAGSPAIDRTGNILVTGSSEASWNGPGGQTPLNAHSGDESADYDFFDIFVLKLASSGAYRWHTFYGGSGIDLSAPIAVDWTGNLYITGSSQNTWNGPGGQLPLNAHSGGLSTNNYYYYFPDIFVLKLDPIGAYQWHTFHGSGDCWDSGNSLVADGFGNLFVTGYSGVSWSGPNGQLPLNAHSGNECNHNLSDVFVLKLKD
jgi:hypothetical protein